MTDPAYHRIDSIDALERLDAAALAPSVKKKLPRLKEHYRRLIEASPSFAIASVGPGGLDHESARLMPRPTPERNPDPAGPDPAGPDPATNWPAIWTLFLGGCTLALHQGKVPSALTGLREDFALSLTEAGSVVSLYAALIALTGVALGLLVARVGYVSFAVVGVALAGAASLLGALADGYVALIVTRAFEGAGWILAVIALPVLIAALTDQTDRPLALGLWGGFVPIGAGSMLILAPGLQALGGWRLSWVLAGVVSLTAAAAIALVCRRHRGRLVALARGGTTPVYRDLGSPLALLIAAAFFLYSFQFLAVTSFLPTLLVERHGQSLGLASALTAMVILVNAVGNLAAGRLLQRGVPAARLLALAALLSSTAAALVYLEPMPAAGIVLCALGFSLLGGAIPGTLFATVPRAASVPASGGPIVGLMLQGSGAGQLLGPIALPAMVEASGRWSTAAWLPLVAGAAGVLVAWQLGRRLAMRG